MDKKVIQIYNKVIECERCGNKFKTISNLRKHFNRKNICEPILKDIPIIELKEKYKVNKGVYKCENCSKEYKSKDGKYKHKKKCLINPIIIEKKENDKLKEELEEKDKKLLKEKEDRQELEEQVKQLLLEKSQIQEQTIFLFLFFSVVFCYLFF